MKFNTKNTGTIWTETALLHVPMSLPNNVLLFWILNIIWRETKASLSTHATPTSRPAILDFCVACVLSLAFASRQIILRIPNGFVQFSIITNIKVLDIKNIVWC